MISLVSGFVLTAASVALIYYVRPQNGQPSRLATAPFFSTAIPVSITGGFILGVALFISGIAALLTF